MSGASIEIGSDVYAVWRRALRKQSGEPVTGNDPVLLPTLYEVGHYDNPQPGLWKKRLARRGPFIPVKIMLVDGDGVTQHTWANGLTLKCVVGNGTDADAEDEWAWCRSDAISQADYKHWLEFSRWKSDPPPLKSTSSETSTEKADAAETAGQVHGGPGHNSGNLTAFQEMREQLIGDCSEARSALRNPITSKVDADRMTDWGQRIAKMAKAADAARRAEQKPLEDAVAEIRRRYQLIIGEADSVTRAITAACDAFIRTERDRLRKIAEEEAKVAREAQMAERARIEEERARISRDDPIAAMTGSLPAMPPEPPPVAAIVSSPPKIMLGSGTVGNRRSLREPPATAVITDLAAAAAYYAAQQHPDLIALIQKLADKAAKAKAEVPGCVMSWQQQPSKQGSTAA